MVVLVPAEVARQSESSSSEVNDPASTSGEKELPQSITSQKEDDTGAALVAEVPSPHREKRIGWVGDVDKLLRAAVESPEIGQFPVHPGQRTSKLIRQMLPA